MTALFVVIFVEQWEKSRQHLPALTGILLSVLCLILFGPSDFLIPSMISITLCLFRLLLWQKNGNSPAVCAVLCSADPVSGFKTTSETGEIIVSCQIRDPVNAVIRIFQIITGFLHPDFRKIIHIGNSHSAAEHFAQICLTYLSDLRNLFIRQVASAVVSFNIVQHIGKIIFFL